jgi:hypothetical protein
MTFGVSVETLKSLLTVVEKVNHRGVFVHA